MLQYSSVGKYLDCVFEESKKHEIVYSHKIRDFWAYNWKSVPDSYWTGYFTTHPDFKLEATEFSDFVQSA